MTETRARYIAIEGPIGVGKSSFAKLIAENYGAEPIFEVVEENPFLEKFYINRSSYAFQTQIFFLMSRYRQLADLSQADLFDRVTVCDYLLQRDLVFARLNLTEDELSLYLDIFRALLRKVAKPDLVVYLQADTGRLMERIKERGRKMEMSVEKSYIDQVNHAFNEYFFNYKEGPLLIINTNQINFVKNESDLTNLLIKIDSDIRGVEFFNPPQSVF